MCSHLLSCALLWRIYSPTGLICWFSLRTTNSIRHGPRLIGIPLFMDLFRPAYAPPRNLHVHVVGPTWTCCLHLSQNTSCFDRPSPSKKKWSVGRQQPGSEFGVFQDLIRQVKPRPRKPPTGSVSQKKGIRCQAGEGRTENTPTIALTVVCFSPAI